MKITYEQFEVVVVPFPFTDKFASKRRPAVILSNALTFNNVINHSAMAMITTASRSSWPLDITIEQLGSAGLQSPSIIRMKLFTLDHELILKRIGILADEDRLKIQSVLQKLLNFSSSLHA
jgi:mRNA interferase MazF